MMVDIMAIVTAVTGELTTLGVLPYVFAGAVIALIGWAIKAVRKVAR